MKIRVMKKEDLNEVSSLHYRTLPGIPTKIGQNYIKNFYLELLAHSDLHTCLVAVEGEKIVGAITMSKNIRQTHKFLCKLIFTPRIMKDILFSVLFLKVSVKDILYRLLFIYKVERFVYGSSGYIMTLFVSKEHRRKGIGKILIKKIIDGLNRGRKGDVILDTRKDNTHARIFYKRIGFNEIISTFDVVLYSYPMEKKTA